uniref:Uncharacterized protein n=1 Tax=Pseudo-nitzschia delicatissima TaxID=44447 RepID=A0A7S0UL91_9STRA|mmetsp:Transcript_2834/g.5887  ORF Transcript_2834/g.5887 Transcript_2834/m.5887 type:complete len:161 (+) Transcript_2834:132-614(+)
MCRQTSLPRIPLKTLKVRFDETVNNVRETTNHRDYTAEERKSTWYTMNDYKKFHTSKMTRNIRFHGNVYVRRIKNHRDYTDEERASMWYTLSDFHGSKQQTRSKRKRPAPPKNDQRWDLHRRSKTSISLPIMPRRATLDYYIQEEVRWGNRATRFLPDLV